MGDQTRYIWTVLIVVAFAGWQFYNLTQRVSGMERAEFRVAYTDSRNSLDAYSKCQSSSDVEESGKTTEIQIELQKQFAALREMISDSPFALDQNGIDLEMQVRDQNPQSKMEDNTVRCSRLSPLGLLKQDDVKSSLSNLEKFVKKY